MIKFYEKIVEQNNMIIPFSLFIGWVSTIYDIDMDRNIIAGNKKSLIIDKAFGQVAQHFEISDIDLMP